MKKLTTKLSFLTLLIGFQQTVFAQTPVLLITDPTAVCSPLSVDISQAYITAGSTDVGALSYWTDAAATISLSNPTSITSSGTYYIKATNGVNTDIAPVNVTINYPVIPYFSQIGSICQGSIPPILQTTSINSPPINGIWNPNIIDASIAGITSYTFIPNVGECATTFVMDITINPTPNLVINHPNPVCAPDTFDITSGNVTSGSTGGGVLSYWTNAQGTVALSNPTTITTFGTYYIKASNVYCSTIRPVEVTIYPLPILIITDPTPVSYPNTIDITSSSITSGSSGGVGLTYYMDDNTQLPNPSTVSCSGIYYIGSVSPEGCIVIAPVNVAIIGCTARIEENEKTNISLSPNPFNNQLTISLENDQESEVSICDISGKQVFSNKFNDKTIKIDLSNLSEGQYIITIKTNSSFITQRIVK